MTFPPLSVTPIYTVLLACVLMYLSIRVIKLRWAYRVAFADGGHTDLGRHIRAHGNFIEYVPFCLLLIGFAEINAAPGWALHLVGAILLIGRLLHAYAVTHAVLKIRIWGMSATFSALAGGTILLITTFFNG